MTEKPADPVTVCSRYVVLYCCTPDRPANPRVLSYCPLPTCSSRLVLLYSESRPAYVHLPLPGENSLNSLQNVSRSRRLLALASYTPPQPDDVMQGSTHAQNINTRTHTHMHTRQTHTKMNY
jgi:hypothetical protein